MSISSDVLVAGQSLWRSTAELGVEELRRLGVETDIWGGPGCAA